MNKQKWLDAAEVFDSWRVVPRSFLYGYWIAVFCMIVWIFSWYMHLDMNGRGNQESGLIGLVVITLIKFGINIFDTYTAKGRDWSTSADTYARNATPIGPNNQVIVTPSAAPAPQGS